MPLEYEEKLAEYAVEQIRDGYTASEVKDFLLEQGYDQQTVQNAIYLALDDLEKYASE